MGVRYEWADDSQRILQIFVEYPWTLDEYRQMAETVMPTVQALNHPVAMIVDISKMGVMPKNGNMLQNLLDIQRSIPENVFVSVAVGAPYPYISMVFMNLLAKLHPRDARITLYARTHAEAIEVIHARYQERFQKQVE